jgi:hypothetical protein
MYIEIELTNGVKKTSTMNTAKHCRRKLKTLGDETTSHVHQSAELIL